MALPTSINTVYAPGSQIQSTDLNDLQTHCVRHELGKRSAFRRKLNLFSGVATGSGAFTTTGGFLNAAAGDALRVVMDLDVGERILNVRARVDPAASGVVSYNVFRVTDGSASSILPGGTAVSSSGAAVQTLTATPTTPELVADNAAILYIVIFTYTVGGGHDIFAADVELDVP